MIVEQEKDVKILFNNGIINKRQLKNLMLYAFHNYGVVKSSIIADKVKNLTFHYATKSGISLSIEFTCSRKTIINWANKQRS